MRRSFVPELPVRVVPFSGYRMNIVRPREVTDWHVVDQRGRTVRVYAAGKDYGVTKRRLRAERFADLFNLRGARRGA